MRSRIRASASPVGTRAPTVSAVSKPKLQRACACGGKTGSAGKRDDDSMLQRRRRPGGFDPKIAPPVVHQVLRSAGSPLDSETRQSFEQRWGHDFSRVRVHTDTRAVESAGAVGALAYTVGSRIVFGREQFAPHTTEGRRLLAHELAHVVQQRGHDGSALPATVRVGEPSSALEVEADRAAMSAPGVRESARTVAGFGGGSSRSLSFAAPTLQRVGECEGRTGFNCNGVRCTTAAGRRGVCQWGGVTHGCNCRDQSGDEPPINRLREVLPYWILAILSAAALAAIAACFASGVCEAGIIIGAAGAAVGAAIIGILSAAGITVTGAEGNETA